MRRFEFQDAISNKFWEVSQFDNKLSLRWGKSGTNGQSQEKEFASSDKAAAAMAKLIKEKTGKGYLETSSSAENLPSAKATIATNAANNATTPAVINTQQTPTLSVEPATDAGSLPDPTSPLETHDVQDAQDIPPWLRNGLPIALSNEYLLTALPNRRFPGEALQCRGLPSWHDFRCALIGLLNLDNIECDAQQLELATAWRAAKQSLQDDIPPTNQLAHTLLMMFNGELQGYGLDQDTSMSEFLLAEYGLEYALEVMLDAQTLSFSRKYTANRRDFSGLITYDIKNPLYFGWPDIYAKSLLILRQALAQAEPRLWQVCTELLKHRIPHLPSMRQAAMAALLPDDTQWNEQLARDLLAHHPDGYYWPLHLQVFDAQLRAQLEKNPSSVSHLSTCPAYGASLLQDHGLAALPWLLPYITGEASANTIAAIGTPEAITALAKFASQGKAQQSRFINACQRWPEASCYALAELLTTSPRDAGLFSATLSTLLQQHPDLLRLISPYLSSSAKSQAESIYQRIYQQHALASKAQLPSLLVNPPWLQAKKKTFAALQLDCLPLPPQFELGEAWQETANPSQAQEQLRLATAINNWRVDPLQWCNNFGISDYVWQGRNGTALPQIKADAIAAMQAQDVSALLAAWQFYKAQNFNYWYRVDSRALLVFPESIAIEAWNRFAKEDVYSEETVIRQFGIATLPGVLTLIQKSPSAYLHYALHFAATELAPLVARAFVKLKTTREIARTWLIKFPAHAITGLLPLALGKPSEARDCACIALRFLASQGQQNEIETIAQRYANESNQTAVLPATLAMLAEDPHDRFPSKIPKAPDFWQTRAWRRPLLKDSMLALDDEAISHLSTMLRFPSNEGVYPGIALVKQACDAQSLADFAWDGFNQWLFAAAPAKENWAFLNLGLFGTDDTARKLTPLIRAWPGESQHARAVTGLEILASIGTDTALMLLNGIAQKVKFKGLQEKAQEKIAQIAEQRQLTPEELADRLAPDLGLDEQGSLLLDFGPRQFIVGFDESLKPYVREYVQNKSGGKLADLPKPKKTDDAELASAALERFKLLKKDARTIASQQVLRLEMAMCRRRRWRVSVFEQFLAGHPLVRHLVQRLVWAVYDNSNDNSNDSSDDSSNTTLQYCFRVASDGSYSNAEDDEIKLPADDDCMIGLPHALELAKDQVQAFSQLFADYELLQPFAQLGRDVHQLNSEELASDSIVRWQGAKVPTGRVLGLVNKGWQRGIPQDAGCIWDFSKALGQRYVAELSLEPGIIVGMVDEYPEQSLGELKLVLRQRESAEKSISFSDVAPIALSELLRDMQALHMV